MYVVFVTKLFILSKPLPNIFSLRYLHVYQNIDISYSNEKRIQVRVSEEFNFVVDILFSIDAWHQLAFKDMVYTPFICPNMAAMT